MNGAHGRLVIAVVLAGALWIPAMAGKTDLVAKYEDKTFYLQSNLFLDGRKSSWVNYVGSADFVPVGAKVTVTKVAEDYMTFEVEGHDKDIEFETEDATPGVEAAVDRVLGEKAPSLAGLGDLDRSGVKSAKVKEGMSRKGVFLAIGYPPYYYSPPFFLDKKSATNHDTDADKLTYMSSTWDFLIIEFDNGKVVTVDD